MLSRLGRLQDFWCDCVCVGREGGERSRDGGEERLRREGELSCIVYRGGVTWGSWKGCWLAGGGQVSLPFDGLFLTVLSLYS